MNEQDHRITFTQIGGTIREVMIDGVLFVPAHTAPTPRRPTDEDFDNMYGECTRNRDIAWCSAHDSRWPLAQSRCNSWLDQTDTAERLIDHLRETP